MEIIAVPSRVAKTQSFWLTVALIAFNGIGVVALVATQQKLLSPEWFAVVMAAVNVVVGALAIGVRYIQQDTELTPGQKAEIAAAIYAAPTKPVPVP